jgi:transcriptional regulator with XRE-family HTH domain
MTTIEAVERGGDIGNRVRELREDALMTQEELAEAAGITKDQVSRIERSAQSPRFRTIKKLADALGVDARELRRGPR